MGNLNDDFIQFHTFDIALKSMYMQKQIFISSMLPHNRIINNDVISPNVLT